MEERKSKVTPVNDEELDKDNGGECDEERAVLPRMREDYPRAIFRRVEDG